MPRRTCAATLRSTCTTRRIDVAGDAIWWLYIVRCADGSLYTGITTDLKRRFAQHVDGSGARYLRGRGPLEMVAHCEAGDRSLASQLEHAFKAQNKHDKERWLQAADGLAAFCRDTTSRLTAAPHC